MLVPAVNRLRELLWAVRGSFWLVPAATVLAGVLAALVLIDADSRLEFDLAERWPRLFGVGAEGSRAMLSAIASSTITVAGVVFSVTMVTLSLAASSYSPRVLRTFMHDRPTQAVFGVFVATFAYCLIVLRTIRGGDEGDGFVPSLAVLGAVVLALTAVAFLVFFIHHVAVAIQASSILARVARETEEAVDELFPENLGEGEDDGEESEGAPPVRGAWRALPAPRSGYLVAVDTDGLLAFARERGAVLRMDRGIGEFVIEGEPLASLSVERAAEDAAAALGGLYSIAQERTIEQDAGFGVQQMVDVGQRALSPGINDLTTAMVCADHLAAVLVRLARRRMPARLRYEAGELRVVAAGPSFAGLVATAFEPLRRSAEGQAGMLGHLLTNAGRVGRAVLAPSRRRAVAAQVEALGEAAGRSVGAPADRDALQAQARRLQAELGEG